MRCNETQLRPAHRAGQRLCMEAAIVRVFVFGAATWTQREIRHRGIGPVVRHARDQRIARPALRAVDERIAVAPVVRGQHLAAAIVAKIIVRRNVYIGLRGNGAGQDLKTVQLAQRNRLARNDVRARQRRRSGNQRGSESIQHRRFTLRLHQHLAGEILHRAAQTETLRQIEHEGAIPHALHPPAHQPAAGFKRNAVR